VGKKSCHTHEIGVTSPETLMAPMVSRSMTDMAADFKGPIGGQEVTISGSSEQWQNNSVCP
jgi:hypothetical protein